MIEREYSYINVSAYLTEIVKTIIEKDELADYSADIGLEVKDGKVMLKISQN